MLKLLFYTAVLLRGFQAEWYAVAASAFEDRPKQRFMPPTRPIGGATSPLDRAWNAPDLRKKK